MEATDILAIRLSADTWNVVMKQLSKRPYNKAAPLIAAIQQQAMQQQQQAQQNVQRLRPVDEEAS